MRTKFQKSISTFVVGAFIVTGVYNAVVINSESHIDKSDYRFVKRVSETYGVTIPGRLVAATPSWQKLKASQVKEIKAQPKFIEQSVSYADAPPADVAPSAAVQDELELNLVEVINPKKWQQGLPNNQFSGNLSTRDGTIETLNVSLPNGEGVSVSFSEMSGNVFEYDYSGEVYSGMMYQVDQTSYMVTLTNGPLEGTRLKFQGAPNVERELGNNDTIAGIDSVGTGSAPEPVAELSQAQAEEVQPVQNEQQTYNQDTGLEQAPQYDETQPITAQNNPDHLFQQHGVEQQVVQGQVN